MLKRAILRVLDSVIRLVMRRVEVVRRTDQVASAQTAVEAVARQSVASDPAGWRYQRVKPFIYPAAPGRRQREADDRSYFLITSQGLAASGWLASSLNLHPEITCSMGIDHPLISMRFYYNDDEIKARTESIRDPRPIRYGFYSETLRQYFRGQFSRSGVALEGDLVRRNPVRNLQQMYNELEWYEPRSRYFGNIHACFAQQALEYLREFSMQRDVVLMNLIRHPIPRTDAAVRAVLTVATHAQDSDWQHGITEGVNAILDTQADRRREIERKFGVDFRELRNRAVLYSYYRALHNDCWAGEITSIPEACHVTIERLMGERGYFAWLVGELSSRRLSVGGEFLNSIFAAEHLQSGRHAGRGRSAGPRAQYNAWSEWERWEFRLAMQRLDLTNVYAPFGYDLSFVC